VQCTTSEDCMVVFSDEQDTMKTVTHELRRLVNISDKKFG